MCIQQILVMARAVGCCLAVCDYNHGPFDLGKRWIAAGDAIIVIMGDGLGCVIVLLCFYAGLGFPAEDIWERIRGLGEHGLSTSASGRDTQM
jgi:hypothetical protein